MTKNFIRFIAGAACPNCKELDKIAITPDDKTIYCLSCDFEEHRPQGSIGKNKKSDLPGHFNIEDFRLKKS